MSKCPIGLESQALDINFIGIVSATANEEGEGGQHRDVHLQCGAGYVPSIRDDRVITTSIITNDVFAAMTFEKHRDDNPGEDDNITSVLKWWKEEKKRRRVEEDGGEDRDGTKKRAKTVSEDGGGEKTCFIRLHETMKQLAVISNLIKSIQAEKIETEYIGDVDQRDVDGAQDGDERAFAMRSGFDARIRATKNAVSRIRSCTTSLRKSIRENRDYQRALLRIQKRWQIVSQSSRDTTRSDHSNIAPFDASSKLAVYCGPDRNKNCALDSKWNDSMFVEILQRKIESDTTTTSRVLSFVPSVTIPIGLSLSIVSGNKNDTVLSDAWLGQRRRREDEEKDGDEKNYVLLDNVSVCLLCVEIFSLAQREAHEHFSVGRISHPTMVRIPLRYKAYLVLRLVYDRKNIVNSDHRVTTTSDMSQKRIPRWTARMLLENMQMRIVEWRTKTNFTEMPFRGRTRASLSVSVPRIRLIESASKLFDRICVVRNQDTKAC